MIITAIWYYILDVVLCVAAFSVARKLYKKLPLINWEKTLRTITQRKSENASRGDILFY